MSECSDVCETRRRGGTDTPTKENVCEGKGWQWGGTDQWQQSHGTETPSALWKGSLNNLFPEGWRRV